jgi:tetratricopeptide (TPR) repeat protein
MDYKIEMHCYEILGRCCQSNFNYEEALRHLSKMLRFALTLRDHDAELMAYDLIGKQFFYQNDMRRAKFFHEKMINGDIERYDSAHRAVQIIDCDRGVSYDHFLTNQNSYKSIIELNIEDLPLNSGNDPELNKAAKNAEKSDKNRIGKSGIGRSGSTTGSNFFGKGKALK